MATDDARVRVASCRDPAEVALVRSILGAHDIEVVVVGENHAALLGGLGGFISLDVWVDRADAERAAALIHSIRDGAAPGWEAEATAGGPEEHDDDGRRLDPAAAIELRRRTGVALLLACVITFGTGHLYAGAVVRAIALAAIEIVGIRYAAAGEPVIAAALILGAVAWDAIGATLRVRRAVRDAHGVPDRPGALPRARVMR